MEVEITDKCVIWLCPMAHLPGSHYCLSCSPDPANVHRQQRRSVADQALLRSRVKELRGQGMSYRQIGTALGVYQSSVRRALKHANAEAPVPTLSRPKADRG